MADTKPQNKTMLNFEIKPYSEEFVQQAIQNFYFAYRDFTSGSDKILKEYSFGRAHHRVIYIVARNPGLTVSSLLGILKITKQSLNRVLGQLIREGFVKQNPGVQDRRKRLLTLTEKGKKLERRLTNNQYQLIMDAFNATGISAAKGFQRVLLNLISSEGDRQRFQKKIVPHNKIYGSIRNAHK